MDQKTKLIVGVVVLALAALLIGRAITGGRVQGKAPEAEWFYDLKTGELFTASAKNIPPIAAPSDPGAAAGVRAYVFSCGACDEAERQVLYLETYSEDARAAMEQINTLTDVQPSAPLESRVERGHYVAAVPATGDEPQWVLTVSPRGQELARAFWTMCGKEGRGSLCPAK